MSSKLLTIGVFYDGGFFQAVSDYYRYHHAIRARLSFTGVHKFAQNYAAKLEEVDERCCRVVDARYFRGRYDLDTMLENNRLEGERRFDDVLMRAGVTAHYLPRSRGNVEKSIDVWFALELYELAVLKKFDIIALIAGDGDFVPLIRKLNTLGTRVMLLSWDFEYQDQMNETRTTRTSQALIEEVSYYVPMHSEIEANLRKKDPVIDGLFYKPFEGARDNGHEPAPGRREAPVIESDGEPRNGYLKVLKDGYGFITDDEDNHDSFFHASAIQDYNFQSLRMGDSVEYERTENEKGFVATRVRVIETDEDNIGNRFYDHTDAR